MINCLIADDAPIARDILVDYCRLLPILHVYGTSSDAFDARDKMLQMPVDLLFLDINMPILNGVDLIKTLKDPPQVIFTTAYEEFAVDAFDLGACDYLVKPFSIERFIIAIDRVIERISRLNLRTDGRPDIHVNDHLLIRSQGKIHKLNYDQILFLEASRNSTRVVTLQTAFLTPESLSSIETLLPHELFSRVHRSFIVNRSKITIMQGNRIFVNKNEIPIGNYFKSSFFEVIGMKTR
jgi:DNA-binding LytR/AlgR family response regulator